ncbi:MAG: 3'-5' exoribonuclease [Firmicutes bacterium]|nr:3'-5' exoribonuclease [Bacillota bacterium]
MREYVTLDLETTGLEPKRDRIIEIGAVKVSNGVVIGEYTTLIDPQLEIPERISKLTGISNDMVQGKPLIQKVLGEFLEFCGDLPLLGHNILFDYSFVKHQAVNCGLEFEKEAVDTLKIARAVLPDLPSRSLQNLRQHFEIPQGDAHRALEDARTTYHLYERLFQEYGQSKPELFCSKPLIYKVKKQGPMTPAQKRYLQDLVKYHRINLNVNPESLTKNEASRLIDEILSTYGKIMR